MAWPARSDKDNTMVWRSLLHGSISHNRSPSYNHLMLLTSSPSAWQPIPVRDDTPVRILDSGRPIFYIALRMVWTRDRLRSVASWLRSASVTCLH
jgi:hypothetical protein